MGSPHRALNSVFRRLRGEVTRNCRLGRSQRNTSPWSGNERVTPPRPALMDRTLRRTRGVKHLGASACGSRRRRQHGLCPAIPLVPWDDAAAAVVERHPSRHSVRLGYPGFRGVYRRSASGLLCIVPGPRARRPPRGVFQTTSDALDTVGYAADAIPPCVFVFRCTRVSSRTGSRRTPRGSAGLSSGVSKRGSSRVLILSVGIIAVSPLSYSTVSSGRMRHHTGHRSDSRSRRVLPSSLRHARPLAFLYTYNECLEHQDCSSPGINKFEIYEEMYSDTLLWSLYHCMATRNAHWSVRTSSGPSSSLPASRRP